MDEISNKVYEIADKYFGEYRVTNGEVNPKYCPFCNGGEHREKYKFYVNLHNGTYKCHRASCDVKGSIYDLCRHFGEYMPNRQYEPARLGQQKKTYKMPDPENIVELTEEAKAYFGMRRISEQTLEDWKIGCDKNGNIAFPFYRDNKLTFVKYRQPRKHTKESDCPKEWQDQGTEPILFGMDMIDPHKPLIITEGEIDSLSLYEAGVRNVVSVPSGANNLEWVQLCWDWLEQFSQIILFGDNDVPGMTMINTLTKRLGEDRCLIPGEYPELMVNGEGKGRPCKDANEILFSYGPETLKDLVDKCELAPVQGIIDISTIQYVDPTTIPRVFTRIPDLDEAIGGLAEGGVTILSGKRGEGKSTIAGQFMLQAIEQGKNVCMYSGELSCYKVFEWLCSQAVEPQYVTTKTDPRNGKVYTFVPLEIQDRVREWLSGHAFLYDNSCVIEEEQTDAILKIFTICVKRYGCQILLVDNLMSALCSPDEENKAQARFVAKLKAFATKYNVHVILIAHPRKEKEGAKFTNDSISGSSAISNLADLVINIERPDIRVTKNREFGEMAFIKCRYNPVNRRIFQENIGDKVVDSWNHDGIKLPTVQAMKLPQFQIQSREEEVPQGTLRQMPF